MNNRYYKEIAEIFILHPDLKNQYNDLYDVIRLINEAIKLQEESNEINKKLNELNQDKEDKKDKK